MPSSNLQIKRAYEPAADFDGERYLIDRLWPRGVRKEALKLTGWIKDVAPSATLRVWFGHDPVRWELFRQRYRQELQAKPDSICPLRDAMTRGAVTLVYAAHDEKHNHAVVLREFLLETLRNSRKSRRTNQAREK